jgi:hypothetical protein
MSTLKTQDVGFVSGPLTSGVFKYGVFDAYAYEENVRKAERVMLECIRLGFPCICVHSSSRYMMGTAQEQVWLDADLAILRGCKWVVLSDDYQSFRSSGTRKELREAVRLGIPVFVDSSDLNRGVAMDPNFIIARCDMCEPEAVPRYEPESDPEC